MLRKSKRSIRIATADVPQSFVECYLRFVQDDYEITFTKDYDADYVFHSVDDLDVLKYKGVRIFVTGENISPNFQISDYALGFDQLSFDDRYIWLPLIKHYTAAYENLKKPRLPKDSILTKKKEFCAYVMSNTTNSADQRTRIYELLSDYKKVNSGGRWRNNVGGPVEDKLAFQATHKFAIAFENSFSPGYLTEKFAEAAMADTIPIYWGDPRIGEIFNPKAFVNCHDYDSLEAVVARVIEIDQNDELYQSMLQEPWFPNEAEPECLHDETFRAFLKNIFEQTPQEAYRRKRSRWGIKIEKQLYDMAHRPEKRVIQLIKKKLRTLRKKR